MSAIGKEEITFDEYRKRHPDKSMSIVSMVPYHGGVIIATSGELFFLRDGELGQLKFKLVVD